MPVCVGLPWIIMSFLLPCYQVWVMPIRHPTMLYHCFGWTAGQSLPASCQYAQPSWYCGVSVEPGPWCNRDCARKHRQWKHTVVGWWTQLNPTALSTCTCRDESWVMSPSVILAHVACVTQGHGITGVWPTSASQRHIWIHVCQEQIWTSSEDARKTPPWRFECSDQLWNIRTKAWGKQSRSVTFSTRPSH